MPQSYCHNYLCRRLLPPDLPVYRTQKGEPCCSPQCRNTAQAQHAERSEYRDPARRDGRYESSKQVSAPWEF